MEFESQHCWVPMCTMCVRVGLQGPSGGPGLLCGNRDSWERNKHINKSAAATGGAVFPLLRFYRKSGDGAALSPVAPHHKSHFPLFMLWKFGLVNLSWLAIGNFELHKFIRTKPAFLLRTFIGFDFRLCWLFLHIISSWELIDSLLFSNFNTSDLFLIKHHEWGACWEGALTL